MLKIDKNKLATRLIVLIIMAVAALFLSPIIFGFFWSLIRGIPLSRLVSAWSLEMHNPSFLLLMQGMQALLVFILPPFLFCWYYKENPVSYLRLRKAKPMAVLIAMLSIVMAIPLINFLVDWNQNIRLPSFLGGLEEWMRASEQQAAYATEMMLQGKSLTDLLWQMLVVAVMAGVGEELFFRGSLQSILSSKIKVQGAIWITAIIFSAIHIQFYGFFPRLLLGAWFGYLLYWSGSVWVPVAAHFANNTISLVFHFAEQNEFLTSDPEQIGVGQNTWQLIPSILLLVLCWLYFFKTFRKSTNNKVYV